MIVVSKDSLKIYLPITLFSIAQILAKTNSVGKSKTGYLSPSSDPVVEIEIPRN